MIQNLIERLQNSRYLYQPLHFFKLICYSDHVTELTAQTRSVLGKKVSSLRRGGFLPAVLYGETVETQSIAVPYKDFEKAYRSAGESSLVTLNVDGKTYNVLIHDISHDALTGRPLHADFYAVRMDKAIRTTVLLVFIGESPAVKNDGGVLVKVMQELEVEALPKDLPQKLEADLSKLVMLEARMLVKDIKVPSGVKIIAEPEEIVAIVEPPRSEEELAQLEQASVGEAPVEVKTEAEVKREEKAKSGDEEDEASKEE